MRIHTRGLARLTAVLLVAGAALLLLGIAYWLIPAGKLPAVPGLGHIAGSTQHHVVRALAATIFGAASLGVGAVAGFTLRARRIRRRRRANP